MRRLVAILFLAALTLVGQYAAANQNGPQEPGEISVFPTQRIDAKRTPSGRFEYITIGPRQQAETTAQVLMAAGARLLRQKDYPTLRLYALIFDLNALPLAQARNLLARAAPQTVIDAHMLYRFAKGAPRLYAAGLVGLRDSTRCTLPPSLRIGMIDGPVATSHPALRKANIVTRSTLASSDSIPNANHGTAVAALLVGRDRTGALAGFSSGARLFAASAFSRTGKSEAADVERLGAALDWLIRNRVRVINMSFAGPVNGPLGSLLAAAAGRGALLIAAAGNNGRAMRVYPAAANQVIAVTAIDAQRRRYSAANTGPYIEFAAPGVDLYVANGTGGHYATGTSFAAPIVAALAARFAARGVTSVDALRARLRAKSVDLGLPGRDNAYGWGLVSWGGC